MMKTTRIVLTVPFMRHPAGLVFELPDTDPIGWDDDERVRERQNYANKGAYLLPDNGRGREVSLPASDTAPCPPQVFEDVDIHTGPCRITAAQSDADPAWTLSEDKHLSLIDLNGRRSQGIRVQLPEGAPAPRQATLHNLLGGQAEHPFSTTDNTLTFDFSALPPGFYSLLIDCAQDVRYTVRFMKSFPLLVVMTGGGRFVTQETMY